MKSSRCVAEVVFLLTAVFYGANTLSLLKQTEKPELVIFPGEETQQIPSGVPFNLQCMADGSSAINFIRMEWIDPRGEVIPERLDFRRLTHVSGSGRERRLFIYSPQRGHSGKYTCLVEYNETLDTSNPGKTGEVERSVNITVLDKPEISKFKNVTVAEGRKAVFVCAAKSRPTPNITIWKANVTDLSDNKDSRIDIKYLPEPERNEVTVTIMPVKRTDEGAYYCTAEANGYYDNETAYLEVQFAPNLTATASQQLLSTSANYTNVTCIAEANPPAVISWEFQNKEIDPENQRDVTYGRTIISSLLIHVNDSSDFQSNVLGTYRCTAKNSLGARSVNITLREAVVPGEITQVIFDRVTPTSVSFRFLGPSNHSGTPVIAYVVNYSTPEDHNGSVVEWPVGSSYILTNLRPGARYTFRVAAKNSVGIGPWKNINYLMPKDANDTTVDPNTLITKDVNITNYPDRFEIRWKVHDDYGMLKRFFIVTYFDDGRVKVEHENGNITLPH